MARTCAARSRAAPRSRARSARRCSRPTTSLMHVPERRPLADVLACIREGMTLEAAGRLTQANAERHLKDAGRDDAALRRGAGGGRGDDRASSTASRFSLDELAHDYPEELREGYATPQAALEAFADGGRARALSRRAFPTACAQALAHELDADRPARLRALFPHRARHRALRARHAASSARGAARRPIRRSASASGSPRSIPTRFDLLFERFVSPERNEPPDIDVDFEHERREEVIQYIYEQLRARARRARGRRDDLSHALGDPRDGKGVRPLRRYRRRAQHA